MKDLFQNLIKLGSKEPELRSHIYSVLHYIEKDDLPESPKTAQGNEERENNDLPEPGTEEYMLTEKDKDVEDVIQNWEEDKAASLAEEYMGKFDQPDVVEKDQLTWFDVNDEVAGTKWDQLIVRDMADPHLDHKDSVFASKHLDIPEESKEDVMRVEGVIAMPGTHVVLVCGSTSGLNTILNWVRKQAKPYLEEE